MIFQNSVSLPSVVTVLTETGEEHLTRSGTTFGHGDIAVDFEVAKEGMALSLYSPASSVSRVICRWPVESVAGARILNDHWERGYGDLQWRGYSTLRMLPWYFLVHDGRRTCGTGVMVQPNAFCFWELNPCELILVCDVRSGAHPVRLGKRRLPVCTLTTKTYEAGSPFAAACDFCRQLSPVSLSPVKPVYGFNDWYYIYGENSAETVTRDAVLLASLTEGLANRPYGVIDAGWQLIEGGCSGGPLDAANRDFGDMKVLADRMKSLGVRPGIWMRPLMTLERLPKGVKLNREFLDPSHPEALRYIGDSVRHLVDDWGYELVKHDYTTFDIFGKWGFEMLGSLTSAKTLSFQDQSKTTAEVILDLYRTIRAAAGTAVILGCNTVSHLAAGLVEVQRTGDDTSGREWARTLKMGVNTLAFRMPHHDAFYAADADCVGLTARIPWALNRQWLGLLARSGTPLFVSASPEAVGPEQREALKEAFALASLRRPVAEPLDWLEDMLPRQWQVEGGKVSYDWYTGSPTLGLSSNDNVFV